jgi:hypothetical protein
MSDTQLRASQLITTFGPGAMVDFPDDSVLIAGLDHWSYDPGDLQHIEEPRLAAKLARLLDIPTVSLRAPPPAVDRPQGRFPNVTAWRFPEWFIVQEVQRTPRGHRQRRLVHLNALNQGRYRDVDGKSKAVVPVRFVRACKKGHIGDIDWPAFVHGAQTHCGRDLWVEERGTTGDLDEIWLVCECGASRAMSQAARLELGALGNCNGSRPWLGPNNKERCGQPNRLLTRSASNAYFPQLLSVISIPDLSSPVDDVVRSLWEDFLSDVETVDGLQKIRTKPTPAAKLAGLTDDAVMLAIARARSGGGTELDRSVKDVEFEALADTRDTMGLDQPGVDFHAKALSSLIWQNPWMDKIQRVVLVHRLREVIAQVGFTRFEAVGPDTDGELDLNVERAPLGFDTSWLPAVENRGEGIFLQFKAAEIEQWLLKPAVAARGLQLQQGFALWLNEHEGSSRQFPGLPYILLHSLSHLLMTAVSLECGYPASSLRERVYAMPGRYGLLIYTGSPDAEGTLGGLVQTGREIARHLRRALDLGVLCSNDPVCAYHQPAEHDHQPLLGAACHGCLLIAETSCEQRNEFLDRTLVVPTVEALDAEFFNI